MKVLSASFVAYEADVIGGGVEEIENILAGVMLPFEVSVKISEYLRVINHSASRLEEAAKEDDK